MPDFKEIRKLENQVLQQNVAPTPFNIGQGVTYEQGGSGKFPTFYLGLDNEDIYAQNQSTGSKWANAAGKFAATTVSTFAQGTAGLINGVYQWVNDGKFSSFYDNEFNRTFDDWTSNLENTLPNYYSQQERDAAWYSPKTWGTANFWADTIFKNSGFAVGAILSGGAWSRALGGLVSATSRAFSIAPQAGAELSTAAEAATLTNKTFPSLNQALKPIAQRLGISDKVVNIGSNAVRAGMATFGEASIEALNASDNYKNRLIQNYISENGFEPLDEDLQKINELSDDVGNATFGANMALLSVTNYIQFPKLGRLFWNQSKAESNALIRGIGSVAVQEGDDLGRSLVSQARVKRWYNPGQLLRYGLLPFSGSEAFEEGAQYAIPITIEDYINRGEQGQPRNILSSLGEGIQRTLTEKEGLISILSGAITGGLMERIGGLTQGQGIAPFRNRQRIIAQNTQNFVNAANQTLASSFIPEGVRSINRFENAAREANEATISNDRLSFEDAKSDAILSYMLPRIQAGRGDLVQDDIQAYVNLAENENGWNDLINAGLVDVDTNRQDYIQNLRNLQGIATNIQSKFDNLSNRYSNYPSEVINYLAYTDSKIDDYNERIIPLQSELETSGVPIGTYLNGVINNTLEEEDFQNLTNQIDGLQGISPELKNNLKLAAGDLLELVSRRQLKIQEYQNILNNPETYRRPQSPIVPSVENQPSAVTVNGEALNENLSYDFGNGQSGFIISEQDGVLTIEDEQGNRSQVDKNLLIQNPNEKARFFLNNRGNNFNVGNRIQGQLSYNPQTDQLFVNGYEITSNDLQSGLVTSDNILGETTFQDSRNEVKIQENLKTLQDLLSERVERQAEIQDRITQHKQELQSIQDELNVQQWTAEELVSRKKGWFPNFVNSVQALTELRDEEQAQLDELNQENALLQAQIIELQDLINNPPTDLIRLTEDMREAQNQMEGLILTNGSLINSLSNIIDQTQKLINRLTGIIRDKLFIFNERRGNPLISTTLRAIDNESPDTINLLNQIREIEDFEIAPARRREQQIQGQIQDLYKEIEDYERQISAKQNILDQLERNLYPIINPIENIEVTQNVEVAPETITETPIQPSPNRGKKRLPGESDKKPLPILFKSTVLPRIDGKTPSWYKRFDNFTKNFKFLPQDRKANIQVIYITANNQEALGVSGLIESTTGSFYEDNDISLTDIDQGRILIAVVETDPETNQTYFIDEAGNRLTEVGKSSDINQVLVAPMANTKSTWENFEGQRFADRNETTIEAEQAKWRQRREEIFQEQGINPVPFLISRGRTIDNLTRKNNIVGILISSDQVGQPGALSIVGSRNITTPYNEPIPGLLPTDVIIENGDAIEKVFANEVDSKNLSNLFTALSIRSDQRIVDYLSGVLYLREGDLNIENQTIKIGDNTFNFTDQEGINNALKGQTQNINRTLLNSQETFIEFQADEQGNLSEYEYPSYQAYLVSPNLPNGEKRQSPIFTYVTGFEDKYLILQDQQYGQKQKDTEPQAPNFDLSTESGQADYISFVFNNLAANVGEEAARKIQGYADRIRAGESRESVLQGLPKSFTEEVDQLLAPIELPVMKSNFEVISIVDYTEAALNNYKPEEQLRFGQGTYEAVWIISNPELIELASIGAKINSAIKQGKIANVNLDRQSQLESKYGTTALEINRKFRELAKMNRSNSVERIIVINPTADTIIAPQGLPSINICN